MCPRSTGVRSVSVAVALIVLTLGCGVDQTTEAVGTGIDGPLLRHLAPQGTDGEDAKIIGTLELENSCLYLGSDHHDERYPIVWPSRTTWDGGRDVVILPNGDQVGIEERISGGGGFHSVDGVERAAGPEAAALAGRCVDNTYGEIAIINNLDTAIEKTDRFEDPIETDGSIAEPVDQPPLGGEWLVAELRVDGDKIDLDPAAPLTVVIEGDEVSGTSGCNSYAGRIVFSSEAGYGKFVVSALGSTKKACAASVMDVERLFLAALQAADSYEAADGLYVSDEDPAGGGATNFHLVRPDRAG